MEKPKSRISRINLVAASLIFLVACILIGLFYSAARRIAAPPKRERGNPSTKVGQTPPRFERITVVAAPDGLENLHQLGDNLWIGGSPSHQTHFNFLSQQGVRFVVSVDGAHPDVASAKKAGLEYIHLPIGYDAVPATQARLLARLLLDAPGGVYVHCHHGKHRGPAAAMAACRILQPELSTDTVKQALEKLGTARRYQGLYQSAMTMRSVSVHSLGQIAANFPSAVTPPPMVSLMVEIDERFSRLESWMGSINANPSSALLDEWRHEAMLLEELFGEAARLPGIANQHQDLASLLVASASACRELIGAVGGKQKEMEGRLADVKKRCDGCHSRFRDKHSLSKSS